MVPQVVSEEEGTGDSEESELSECQQKLQKFTEALKSAHRAIDKPKLKRVEELEENDPQGAEMICRELIGLEEDRAGMGPGVTDDTTILHRKYKLAELLLSQKKYPEAEVTARDVYEKRKRHSGEASKTTRLSLLLICRALRGPKPIESYTEKYREAETTHWNIWHLPKDESNKCWRVQNGYELAMVVAEQNHCKEAVIVYNEVREAEKAIADLRPDERSAMLDSRHKLGEILCREKHFEDAVSVLKPVWDEKESMATAEVLATSLGWLALGKETVSMATAEALAISLGSLALWKEGGNIRRWICNEVRRKKLPEDHPKVIECRLNYGKVLLKTEEFTEAAYQLGKALGHRDQEHFDADDCETLEIRHYYCKALVGKGDYAAAEGWTRKVWERRWQILPDLDRNKLTMESCHLYGFVMLKLKNFLGAENILGQVSNLRKMVIGPDHFDTLESSLEYGNSLLEQNSAEKWSRARNVFSEAWNFRDCDSIRAQPVIAYDTILKIGCSLAYTLRKLGEYDVARILMEDVFEKKRRHLYPKVLSDGDPFRIALADMRQPRPPPATQPPPPPPPPPTPPPPPPPPTPKHREGKQRRVYVLPYINGRPADPSGKHRKPKKPRKPEGTRKTDGSIRTEATRGSVGTRGSGGTRKPEGMNRPGYPLKVKMKFGLSAL
jgi:tetratricopeptide (TPR) repeat protein